MSKLKRLNDAIKYTLDYDQLRIGYVLGNILLLIVLMIYDLKYDLTKASIFWIVVIIIVWEFIGTVIKNYTLGGNKNEFFR